MVPRAEYPGGALAPTVVGEHGHTSYNAGFGTGVRNNICIITGEKQVGGWEKKTKQPYSPASSSGQASCSPVFPSTLAFS